MSEIRLFHTRHGMIVGDCNQKLSPGRNTSWIIEKPALVAQSQSDITLIPLMQICIEDTIELRQEDIYFGGPFEPIPEIRNHYSSIFGSGIQVPGGVKARNGTVPPGTLN